MRWTQSIGRGREYRRGRAAWTSATAPRLASWRWPDRPFGVRFVKICPMQMARQNRPPHSSEMASPCEDGRANAGREGPD